jgi:hypothetical protein
MDPIAGPDTWVKRDICRPSARHCTDRAIEGAWIGSGLKQVCLDISRLCEVTTYLASWSPAVGAAWSLLGSPRRYAYFKTISCSGSAFTSAVTADVSEVYRKSMAECSASLDQLAAASKTCGHCHVACSRPSLPHDASLPIMIADCSCATSSILQR